MWTICRLWNCFYNYYVYVKWGVVKPRGLCLITFGKLNYVSNDHRIPKFPQNSSRIGKMANFFNWGKVVVAESEAVRPSREKGARLQADGGGFGKGKVCRKRESKEAGPVRVVLTSSTYCIIVIVTKWDICIGFWFFHIYYRFTKELYAGWTCVSQTVLY